MRRGYAQITDGQYDDLTLLTTEIKGIGLFLHNMEVTAIQGTSRKSLWNFGEALMDVAKRIKKITDSLDLKWATLGKEETPTDSGSQ